MTSINYNKFLPLSEASYYVLVSLTETLHGYAIMQKVESISEGSVSIGPGTLYGAFSTLEKQGLICKVSEEERRKSYALSDLGKRVLTEQIRRLEIMSNYGRSILADLTIGEK